MVDLWRAAIGGAAVVLGIAWMVAPAKMAHLQNRLLTGGFGGDVEQGDLQILAGRIGGALLAVLGVVFAAGLQV